MDYERAINDIKEFVANIKNDEHYNSVKIREIEDEISALKFALDRKFISTMGRNCFSKQGINQVYYFINAHGEVDWNTEEEGERYADSLISVANYCTDEKLLKDRARWEVLSRLLWRWIEENDRWEDWDGAEAWYIGIPYGHRLDEGVPAKWPVEKEIPFGLPYFTKRELCERCIKEIYKPYMEKNPVSW